MSQNLEVPQTILVVDDSRASSALVEYGLATNGWRVIVARSGEECLAVAQQQKPDLILLDILMPGMDGLETCRHLKEARSTRDIPVIFMTALTDSESQLAGFEAGGVDYVVKPFNLLEVIARVRNHLTLQRYREQLQDLVEERTIELKRANEELVIAHQQVQAAQAQLIQSEKMASLGVLAAGVAHEINNPVGFVSSNVLSLEEYVAQLLEVIAAYRQAEPLIAQHAPEQFMFLKAVKEKCELDFIAKDAPTLLSESKEGLERIKKIVQDLKDFSHVGQKDWRFANVNQGLESTLNIVRNELKYKAEVVCNYRDVPDIECLPSELNQVFMNLLVNAGHAIEERGKITIATGVSGNEVWIEIADTGSGIPADILGRIYEPFFTTKPVGRGTGLGLFLSYSIIKKHQGRIEVHSVVGQGTTFRVWLPIKGIR